MTIQKNILSVILTIIAVVLIGCGGNQVLLKPNYSKHEIVANKVKNANVRTTAVIDRRTVDKDVIGSARVGMLDKTVPYRTAVPVAAFVKRIFDSLLVADSSAAVIPVVAYIDTMEVKEGNELFAETGIFQAKVIFGVPVTRDSLLYITTRFDETISSALDITDRLEPLIYKGIVDCGRQFADKVRSMNVQWFNAPPDSASAIVARVQERSVPAQTIEAVVQKPAPKSYPDIGFMFSGGNKIQSGFRFSYNMYAQKDSSLTMPGFGYILEILSIDNADKEIKGTIVTFGGAFGVRFLMSDAPTSGFIGGTGSLVFGNESIDYGGSTKTSFFIGPIIRETIGVTFNKKAYLEFGLYEVKLFGSTMLPDDIGFTAGLAFGI